MKKILGFEFQIQKKGPVAFLEMDTWDGLKNVLEQCQKVQIMMKMQTRMKPATR